MNKEGRSFIEEISHKAKGEQGEKVILGGRAAILSQKVKGVWKRNIVRCCLMCVKQQLLSQSGCNKRYDNRTRRQVLWKTNNDA